MIEVSQENIDLYAARIKNFELEAGESFTDYFMDGEVFAGSWGFWLIGKGYTKRGNAIINAYNKANKNIGQTKSFALRLMHRHCVGTWIQKSSIHGNLIEALTWIWLLMRTTNYGQSS